MVRTVGVLRTRVRQSHKARRSPERRLQLDSVKSESRVFVYQHVAMETLPGLVHTAHRTLGALVAWSSWLNREEGDYHGGVRDWDEFVTR